MVVISPFRPTKRQTLLRRFTSVVVPAETFTAPSDRKKTADFLTEMPYPELYNPGLTSSHRQDGRNAVLTHLRQLEILTSCFTSTFRAEKATWHYITFSDCISELGADPPLILRRNDPCRASVAALGGREGPASVARVCRSARRRSDSRNVAPTESQL